MQHKVVARSLSIPNNLYLLLHATTSDLEQIQEELNAVARKWSDIIAQRRAEAHRDLIAITESTDHNEL